MRSLFSAGLAAAVLMATVSTARAQDSRPFRPKIGVLADGTDMPIEATSVSTVGNPDPNSTDRANHKIDYTVRHVFFGVTLGVHVELPQAPDFEGEMDFLLGSVSTTLTESIHTFSVHEPNAGDQEHRNTAIDEGDLAVGLQLRGWYNLRGIMERWLQDRFRVGLDYQFLTGSATLNDERFFDDLVDGDYTFNRHRFTILLGGDFGFIRPYIGLSFLIYDANLDVEEADRPAPDEWDVDFESEGLFTFRLGAEVSGDRVGGRVEIHTISEWGLGVSLFVKL